MRLLKCKICGVETTESHDGMCRNCFHKSYEKNEEIEDNGITRFKWVAKIAKMGKYRRVIEVPKNQRSLIDENKDYIVIIEER